jgi:rhamnulokinase
MTHCYVACDLGAETGRVILATLHRNEQMTINEVHRFQNTPVLERGSIHWNIPEVYGQIMHGLRAIGAYEDPVESISSTAWASDYMLFGADGALMPPIFHYRDPRTQEVAGKTRSLIEPESAFAETGVQFEPPGTFFQLAADSSRRIRKARWLMPIADGFNFLLGGTAAVEMSSASATQLFNPNTSAWSEAMFETLGVRLDLFPDLVTPGTDLGSLRSDIARETNLHEVRVMASYSNRMCAELAGLPVPADENWAFLRLGPMSTMGTQLQEPRTSAAALEMGFSNYLSGDGAVCFHKQVPGISLLHECRRFWDKQDRGLDDIMLAHLAGASPAFESLIDPSDPRFLSPGDMPLKIQAFCRETGQPVPRKPGPVFRCILESLALHYRRTLEELNRFTISKVQRLYILPGYENSLLHYSIANALHVQVVILPPEAAALGSIAVQVAANKHVESLERAQHLVFGCCKAKTIVPRGAAWDGAYVRFSTLSARAESGRLAAA